MAKGPLAIFRKHQKWLLAIFGVAIMIVFTLSVGSVDLFTIIFGQGGRGGSTDVVVTWKGGELNEREMQNMRLQHRLAVAYLYAVLDRAVDQGATPEIAGATLQNPGIPGTDAEEVIVETVLLAKRAKEMGVVVSDEAVFQFLEQLSGGIFDRPELGKILSETVGRQLNSQQLLNILRRELLARRMRLMVGSGLVGTSPNAAWDYFRRLNQTADAEILPIAVDQFVSQVQEPSNQVLREFFDKYSTKYSFPASPEPGFRLRQRIAFEYLKADYNKFLEEERAKITNEEVQGYYEENKNEFRVREEDGDVPTGSAPGPELGAPSGNNGGTDSESRAEDAGEISAGSGDGEEAPVDRSETEAESGDVESGLPKSGSAESGEESAEKAVTPGQGSDEPGESDAVGDDSATPADNDQSWQHRWVRTRFIQNGEDEPAAEDDGDNPAATDPTIDAPQAPEPKYRPLEEVADDIRERLARPLAGARFEKAVSTARTRMDKYFQDYIYWKAISVEDSSKPMPEKPDLKALAKELGMTAGKTPLVDQFEVQEYDIGQVVFTTFRMVPSPDGRAMPQRISISFPQFAYQDNFPKFKPRVFPDTENIGTGNDEQYVFWVDREKPSEIPRLDEVKEKVVKTWKQVQAREIAREKAESHAKQVRESGESLAQAFGNTDEVIVADGFSFYDPTSVIMFRSGMGGLQVDEVKGTEMIGNRFMEAVFERATEGVAVAPNEPETIFYVIRVEDLRPSAKDLRGRFVASFNAGRPRGAPISMPQEVAVIAYAETQQLVNEVMRQFLKDYEVEWQREPAVGGQGG